MSQPLDHTIDPFRYDQLREDYRALWQPENCYIAGKVDDLAAKRFHLERLKAVHCQCMQEIYAEFGGAVKEMELFVTAKESILMRLETRVRQAELAMSRLERDIQRLKKFFAPNVKMEGPSQKVEKTKEQAAPIVAPPPQHRAARVSNRRPSTPGTKQESAAHRRAAPVIVSVTRAKRRKGIAK